MFVAKYILTTAKLLAYQSYFCKWSSKSENLQSSSFHLCSFRDFSIVFCPPTQIGTDFVPSVWKFHYDKPLMRMFGEDDAQLSLSKL
jgi:hypothetical protein